MPQAQFSSAVEQIELVGKVQSKNLGSEDVSERFIDLQARLKSSLREEESLLSLLGGTSTVSGVLAIERAQGDADAQGHEVDACTGDVEGFAQRGDQALTDDPSGFGAGVGDQQGGSRGPGNIRAILFPLTGNAFSKPQNKPSTTPPLSGLKLLKILYP